MDANPDLVAAVAVEAWLMARSAALRLETPAMSGEQATQQALAELRQRYPALGGTLRRLTVANTFGSPAKDPGRPADGTSAS